VRGGTGSYTSRLFKARRLLSLLDPNPSHDLRKFEYDETVRRDGRRDFSSIRLVPRNVKVVRVMIRGRGRYAKVITQ